MIFHKLHVVESLEDFSQTTWKIIFGVLQILPGLKQYNFFIFEIYIKIMRYYVTVRLHTSQKYENDVIYVSTRDVCAKTR